MPRTSPPANAVAPGPRRAWPRDASCSSPGDAGETAALVRDIQELVANGGGGRKVGAAKVLDRQGGRVVVAVSVGVS